MGVNATYGKLRALTFPARTQYPEPLPCMGLMPRRKWYFLTGGVLVIAVLLSFTGPSSPAGHYVEPSTIGAVGDWYSEFADGKVTFVIQEDKDYTVRQKDAEYTKTNGIWVLRPTHKGAIPYRIRCSWLGLWISDKEGSHFLRRRFYRGRRPDWMLDHLPWCIQ